MASMNSSVLACMNHTIPLIGSADLYPKLAPMPSSVSLPASLSSRKLSVIRTQLAKDQSQYSKEEAKSNEGRRAALVFLAAGTLFAAGATASTARAGVIEEYLERSKSNKELNDKKRLVTSGANFARAFTVQFGSCKFPQNFTGCQDLAKQKKVPFLSEDLDLECQGKDKFRCGSNVFWKW